MTALCGAPTERGDGTCRNPGAGCPHHPTEAEPVDVRALLLRWDAQANRGAGPMRQRCRECGADGPFAEDEFKASGMCGNCLWGDQPKPLDYEEET